MIRLPHRVTLILLIILTTVLLLLPDSLPRAWRLSAFGLLGTGPRAAASEPGPSLERRRGGDRPEERRADLERQVAELSTRLSQSQAEVASLKRRLRNLAEVQEYLPTVSVQPAHVLQRLGGLPYHAGYGHGDRILIDRGRRLGVKPGDAILQGQAALGVVIAAGPDTAEVQLLSHPDLVIAARLGQKRTECYLRGGKKGEPEVVFLGRAPEVGPGTLLFTSGLLGIFPPNLILGELVTTPVEGRNGRTYTSPLIPRARLDSIEEVLVLQRKGSKGALHRTPPRRPR
ncbi:MAG: rod shape-determining protein MreC [Planctomycetota bacterium]|jgi:cell shape-determining protein MreC